MDYETIRMLGLQDINVDLDKSFITHDKNLTIYNIYLKKPDEVICPVCGRKGCNVLGYTSKTIDHSILTSEKAIIKYYSRRYKCKICGKSFELKTLLIQKGHKTSNQTLIMIIDEFRSHTSTFTSIAKKYFLKIQTVINIFEKYIICERQPLPKILCIDEIYTRKLTKNNPYACVMMDFQTRKLVDIVSSRRKDKLSEYFNRISKKERENVKYIVIDMYEPYKQLAALYFKDALVAVDSFHVMKNLNAAIDKIRIKVMQRYNDNHKCLNYANDYYYFLKKFANFLKLILITFRKDLLGLVNIISNGINTKLENIY